MSRTKDYFMDTVQSGFDPDYDHSDEDYFYDQEQEEFENEEEYEDDWGDRVDEAYDRYKDEVLFDRLNS